MNFLIYYHIRECLPCLIVEAANPNMVHGNLERDNTLVFVIYCRGQSGSRVYGGYYTSLEEDPKNLLILDVLLICRIP